MISLTTAQKNALLESSLSETTNWKLYLGAKNRSNRIYDSGFKTPAIDSSSWTHIVSAIDSVNTLYGQNSILFENTGGLCAFQSYQYLNKKNTDFGLLYLEKRVRRLEAGKRYVASVYYKMDAYVGANTVAVASDGPSVVDELGSVDVVSASPTTCSWTRVQFAFTATHANVGAIMPDTALFNIQGSSTAGDIWFACPMLHEDIQFEDLTWHGSALPYIPLEPSMYTGSDGGVLLTNVLSGSSINSNAAFDAKDQVSFPSGTLNLFNEELLWNPTAYNVSFDPTTEKYIGKKQIDGFGMFRPGNRIVGWNSYIDTNDVAFDISIGVFVIESIKTNVSDGTITIELSNYWSDLSRKIAMDIVGTKETSDDIIRAMAILAGYNVEQDDDYLLTTGSFNTNNIFLVGSDDTGINILSQIAQANMKSIYVDQQSRLIFRDISTAYTDSTLTLTESHVVKLDQDTGECVSVVVVKSDPIVIKESSGTEVDQTKNAGNIDAGRFATGTPYVYTLTDANVVNPDAITPSSGFDNLFNGTTKASSHAAYALANGLQSETSIEYNAPYIEIDLGQGAHPVSALNLWFDTALSENYYFKVTASLNRQNWWYLAGESTKFARSNPNQFVDHKTVVSGFPTQYLRYIRVYMNGSDIAVTNKIFDIQVFRDGFQSSFIGWDGSGYGTVELSASGIKTWKNETHTNANITFEVLSRTGHTRIRGIGVSDESDPILYIQGTASSGFKIYDGGVSAYNCAGDKTLSINTANGDLCITGTIYSCSGAIGGWDIGCKSLTAGTGTSSIGLVSCTTAGSIAFFAGNGTPALAPFRVTNEGCLVASNATICGIICACVGGFIGGFAIGATDLTAGTGSTAVGMSSCNTCPAFWTGATLGGSAPFQVSHAGALTSTSGSIGGWTINGTSIYKLSGATYGGIGMGDWGALANYGDSFWVNSDGAACNYAALGKYLWDGSAWVPKYGVVVRANNQTIFIAAACCDGTALDARIAGWNFDSYKMYAGSGLGSGVNLVMSTVNSGSGYAYANSQILQGYAMTWHYVNNAGFVSLGQMMATANTLKTDFYGLQMMNHGGAEYFALGGKIGANCFELYNRIAGWCFDSTDIYSNNLCMSSAGAIGTMNFTSGLRGWYISCSGTAEFNSVIVRGELRSSVFKYDELSVVGGQALIVSADTITVEATTGSDVGVSYKICAGAYFCLNDIVRMKTLTNSGVMDAWGKITACAAVGGGIYEYCVIHCSGSCSAVFPKKTAVASYGPVTGGNGILLNGQGDHSAYIDIFSHDGDPWTHLIPGVRLGNISGMSVGGSPLGAGTHGLWTCNGYFVGGVIVSNNYGAGTGSCFNLADGCLVIGGTSPTFSVTPAGALTATSGAIAGWSFNSGAIWKSWGTDCMITIGGYAPESYCGTYGPQIGVWSTAGGAWNAIQFGRCLYNGAAWEQTNGLMFVQAGAQYFRMTVSDAGVACANISGWNFNSSCLYNGNLILNSSGAISGCYGASTGWCINAAGAAVFNEATVRGTVCSSCGIVGGWTITAETLCSTTSYGGSCSTATLYCCDGGNHTPLLLMKTHAPDGTLLTCSALTPSSITFRCDTCPHYSVISPGLVQVYASGVSGCIGPYDSSAFDYIATKKHRFNTCIQVGDSAGSTSGSLGLALTYSGENFLNTFGSMYSSGHSFIGFAVRPESGVYCWVSSAGNAALGKGALHVGDSLEYLNYPGCTIAIGTRVPMVSRFVITSAGNVGIGTTTPYTELEIGAGTLGANGYAGFNIAETCSRTYLLIRKTAGNVAYSSLFNDASAALVLQEVGGNVGIGVTPSYRFDVLTTTANDRAIAANNNATTGTNYAGVFQTSGSGATCNIGIYAFATGASDSAKNIAIKIDSTLGYGLYEARGVYNFMCGSLGLGTATSPQAPLDIRKSGIIAMFGDDNASNYPGFMYMSVTNTFNSGYYYDADTGMYINYLGYLNSTSRYRTLYIHNGKQSQIAAFCGPDSSFYMTGGRITVSCWAASACCAVWACAYQYGVIAVASSAYGMYATAPSYAVFASATNYAVYGCSTGSYGVLGKADTGFGVYGNAPDCSGAGNTGWNAASSRHFKVGIKQTQNILESLRSVGTYQYHYHDRNARGMDSYIGPLAEDINAAFGLTFDDQRMFTVDGIALAGVKELDSCIESQKTCINCLEERITRLEKAMNLV